MQVWFDPALICPVNAKVMLSLYREETLPAPSLNQAYTVFDPLTVVSVNSTLIEELVLLVILTQLEQEVDEETQ